MQDLNDAIDTQNPDLAAIEKRARQLRAEAGLELFKSVKSLFSGLRFGAKSQAADA